MEFGMTALTSRAACPATSLRTFNSRPASRQQRLVVRTARAEMSTAEESKAPAVDDQKKAVEELTRKRLQQKIAEQDSASQSDLVAENLQASSEAVQFQVFGQTQEVINGRAAMLGFVAAVVAELKTGQSVWSQLAGKYVDGDLTEHAIGTATLGFGAVVALLTYASIAPMFQAGEKPDSRSFGVFTPFLEAWTGRVAMLGFSGLLLVELLKGNTPVF